MDHSKQIVVEGFCNFAPFYKQAVDGAPDKAHFVEVGSWKGQSACFMGAFILESGKDIKLSCVDTWEGSEEHSDDPDVIAGKLYERFLANIEPVKDVITPIRCESVKAAKYFEDGSIDFCFIDAAHDYDNVLADIKAWWPKVKPGGIFSGHDFNQFNPGVQQAAIECFGGVFQAEGDVWLVFKPSI